MKFDDVITPENFSNIYIYIVKKFIRNKVKNSEALQDIDLTSSELNSIVDWFYEEIEDNLYNNNKEFDSLNIEELTRYTNELCNHLVIIPLVDTLDYDYYEEYLEDMDLNVYVLIEVEGKYAIVLEIFAVEF